MSQSKTANAKTRVSPASGIPQSPSLSVYKRDEIIKTSHEKRRVANKPCRDVRLPFRGETIASLYKRKSFRSSSKELHLSMLKRRPESVDPGTGRESCATHMDVASTMTQRATVDAATLKFYAIDTKNNPPSEALNPNATQIRCRLLQLRDDVEIAYKIFSEMFKPKEAGSADAAAGNDGVLDRSKSSSLVADFESILDEIQREDSSSTQSIPSTQSAFSRTASFPDKLEVSPSLESPDAAHEKSRPNSQRTMETQASEEESVGEEKSDESVLSADSQCGADVCSGGASVSVLPVSDSQTQSPVVEAHRIYLPGNSRQPNVSGNLVLAGISLVFGVFVGHVFSRGEN